MPRAMDCIHDAHDDVHFTGADDDDLVRQVERHIDEHHPDMSREQAREIVAASAYDE